MKNRNPTRKESKEHLKNIIETKEEQIKEVEADLVRRKAYVNELKKILKR